MLDYSSFFAIFEQFLKQSGYFSDVCLSDFHRFYWHQLRKQNADGSAGDSACLYSGLYCRHFCASDGRAIAAWNHRL